MTRRPDGGVLERIRSEFLEMPDLHLTARQARRLWSLDAGTCDHVLRHLVNAGFLRETRRGAYRRHEG